MTSLSLQPNDAADSNLIEREATEKKLSDYRLVILNDFDRPEVRMIALVRESEKGCEWTYLSADKRLRGSKWLAWNRSRHFEEMTDLETFGVEPVIEIRGGKHLIRVERIAPSRASYADGHPRNWQGYIGELSVVRPGLVSALKAFTSQPIQATPPSSCASVGR